MMAKTVTSSGLRVGAAFTALALLSSFSTAASVGSLRGIVQNEAGQPLPNILVTVLDRSSELAIPILARTNEFGHLFIKDIEAGDYQVAIKSTDYRTAGINAVEVFPGKTSIIKLVLQEFLNAEGDDRDNIGIKSLLRTSTARRMIFRDQQGREPELGLDFSPLFDNAVFQVYTNAGFGDGYLIFPGSSNTGTSTNFAFVDSFFGNSKYIFAGQLSSGEDSLWRLKNVYQYELGDFQSLAVYLGYGRMSFQQPSLALLDNPGTIGDEVDYFRALGTTKMFNFGVEDRLSLGSVALVWGLDFNQIWNHGGETFVNPSLSVAYSPTPRTTIDIRANSKRTTLANAVFLPDGQLVNLDDSMHYARIGDQLTFGTSRYYQASVAQKIGSSSEVELASFITRRMGGTLPFLAVFEFRPGYDVLHLADEQAGTRGYRMTWNQQFTPVLRGSISFIRANALGLPEAIVGGVYEDQGMMSLIRRRNYNSVSAQLDTSIPQSHTTVTALVKLVPGGRPISTLDPYSDLYETGNQGVNLFVRQVIPVPASLLSFVGLDFLTIPRLEALLDLRNVLDEKLGRFATSQGDVILVRAPRSVRGGISFKF
ncbi:MAG: carboxypeptidase-like regulatory domain-containing protein [Acidobacteriota bacterium]